MDVDNGSLRMDFEMEIPSLDRSTPLYNEQELTVLNVFKADYLEANSPTQRKTLARTQIFPALWTYWKEQGTVVTGQETVYRARELIDWMRNIWRGKPAVKYTPGFKVRPLDVVWRTHQDLVWVEIAKIMGIPSADSKTAGWFGHRLPACAKVLKNMSVEDKRALEEETDKMRNCGMPVDVQRKLAVGWERRFAQAARDHYLEMGLLSISVVVYQDESGQLMVDVHDEIPTLMRVPVANFKSSHKDLILEVKRKLVHYVRKVQNIHDGIDTDSTVLGITHDQHGFPKVPPGIQHTTTKEVLEKLLMLATQGKGSKEIPWTVIKEKVSAWVKPLYLPAKFEFTNPRSMKKEQILNLFAHIKLREEKEGIPQAFRFRSVMLSRKHGTRVPAAYEYDGDTMPDRPQRQRTKAAAKGRSGLAAAQPFDDRAPTPNMPLPSRLSMPITELPMEEDDPMMPQQNHDPVGGIYQQNTLGNGPNDLTQQWMPENVSEPRPVIDPFLLRHAPPTPAASRLATPVEADPLGVVAAQRQVGQQAARAAQAELDTIQAAHVQAGAATQAALDKARAGVAKPRPPPRPVARPTVARTPAQIVADHEAEYRASVQAAHAPAGAATQAALDKASAGVAKPRPPPRPVARPTVARTAEQIVADHEAEYRASVQAAHVQSGVGGMPIETSASSGGASASLPHTTPAPHQKKKVVTADDRAMQEALDLTGGIVGRRTRRPR